MADGADRAEQGEGAGELTWDRLVGDECDRLVRLIREQERPDQMGWLGAALAEIVQLDGAMDAAPGPRWQAHVGTLARRDPKVATALQRGSLIRQRRVFDLIGVDHLADAWVLATEGHDPDTRAPDPWGDWALQLVIGLFIGNDALPIPEAWDLVLRLLAAARTEWTISAVGIGPLADLFSTAPEHLVALIEAEAPHNPRLGRALAPMPRLGVPLTLYARAKALARPPDHPPEQPASTGETPNGP